MALPKDELELISKKLMFALDYTRFRSVCKSWRSAAPKRPQIPWLISYHQTDSDENTISLNFYHFSFETNKITRIHELSDLPLLSSFIDESTVCVGSSRGWLALINSRTSSVSIFNPLTNSTINLPNLPNRINETFTYIISCLLRFILTSDPGESLSDCFALIYCSDWITYYKVGSNGWIELMPHPEIDMYNGIHICCYQGNLFIASLGNVFLCDFSQNHSVCKIVSVDSNDTGMDDFELERSYLVESDGDLFLVLIYSKDYDDDMYFRVFKLDFERQLVKLAELKSLGEKTLFLSPKIAVSLTASKYPGCKENSIYYSWIEYDSVEPCINQTLAVFDFEGPSSVSMKTNLFSVDGMNCDNCAWFQPSLLI